MVQKDPTPSLPSSSDIVDTYSRPISYSAVRAPDIKVDEISICPIRLVQAVLAQSGIGVAERQCGVSVARFALKRSSRFHPVEPSDLSLQFINHRFDIRGGRSRAFPACLIRPKCFQAVFVRSQSEHRRRLFWRGPRRLCGGLRHLPGSGAGSQHSQSDYSREEDRVTTG